MMFRYTLSAWPPAMLVPVYLASSIPAFWTRWSGKLSGLALLGALVLNAWLLVDLRTFYGPCRDPGLDRDYHTYLYSYMLDRERGVSYRFYGTHANYDVEPAFANRDWERVIRVIESASPDAKLTHSAIYFYANSLAMVGRTAAARHVCAKLAPDYPDARPLHVELALAMNDSAAAARLLEKYIPTSSGEVREQLAAIAGRLGVDLAGGAPSEAE